MTDQRPVRRNILAHHCLVFSMFFLIAAFILTGCLKKNEPPVSSSEPAPVAKKSTTTTTEVKEVPKVVGLPLAVANQVLTAAGFAVSTPGLRYGGNDRTVSQQQPAGGALVPVASSEIVSLSLAESSYTFAAETATTASTAESSSAVTETSGTTTVTSPLNTSSPVTTTTTSTSATTSPIYTYEAYTSPSLGFKLEYPQAWSVGSFSLDTVVLEFFTNMSGTGAGNNVSIVTEDIPTNTDLDTYMADAEAQLAVGGITITNKKQTTIGGIAAYEYDLPESAGLKQSQVVAVYDSQAWILTYSAGSATYAADLPAFDHMIESFVFPALSS